MLFPCWLSKRNYSHQPEIALHLQGMSLRGSLCSCVVYEQPQWGAHGSLMWFYFRGTVWLPLEVNPSKSTFPCRSTLPKQSPGLLSLINIWGKPEIREWIKPLQEKWDAVMFYSIQHQIFVKMLWGIRGLEKLGIQPKSHSSHSNVICPNSKFEFGLNIVFMKKYKNLWEKHLNDIKFLP